MTNENPPFLLGPYGSPVLKYADKLSAYEVNAIWFHGFDADAFDSCAQHRLAACVEFKTFRTDFEQHPECIPIGIDGKPIRYGELVQGVCLSQKDFLAATEESLIQRLKDFKPTGVWLDYLTYPGWFETMTPDLQESCFCTDCVAEFCDATGIDSTTPQQILDQHAKSWQRHKCERVAKFAAHYASIIKKHHPECIVGAYMCPWTPNEFDGALSRIFAQDYRLLAPSIEIFTPLIYAKKSGRSADWGRDFLDQASSFIPSGRKVQLILDALDFPTSLEAITNPPSQSWGIQMFAGVDVFSDPQKAKTFAQAASYLRENSLN